MKPFSDLFFSVSICRIIASFWRKGVQIKKIQEIFTMLITSSKKMLGGRCGQSGAEVGDPGGQAFFRVCAFHEDLLHKVQEIGGVGFFFAGPGIDAGEFCP